MNRNQYRRHSRMRVSRARLPACRGFGLLGAHRQMQMQGHKAMQRPAPESACSPQLKDQPRMVTLNAEEPRWLRIDRFRSVSRLVTHGHLRARRSASCAAVEEMRKNSLTSNLMPQVSSVVRAEGCSIT